MLPTRLMLLSRLQALAHLQLLALTPQVIPSRLLTLARVLASYLLARAVVVMVETMMTMVRDLVTIVIVR